MSAHIIGVVVSETTSEIMTAADSVSANSLNSRPTMPPKKISGANTAISDSVIERTVKPTSFAPTIAASRRGMPSSRWRDTFSSTTIASSTTKPVEIVSAISDRLSRLKPARYITPNVPMIEVGTATLGIAAARTLRRKANTTRITSTTAMISVFCVSASDWRMVFERSTAMRQVDVARQRRDQPRQLGLHGVDDVDDVGAGLARHDHRHAGLAVDEAGVAQVLDRVDDLGDVARA